MDAIQPLTAAIREWFGLHRLEQREVADELELKSRAPVASWLEGSNTPRLDQMVDLEARWPGLIERVVRAAGYAIPFGHLEQFRRAA